MSWTDRVAHIGKRVHRAHRSDVLVVVSRHGQSLTDLCQPFDHMVVDPTNMPIIASARYLVRFLTLPISSSRLARYLVATARASQSKVLVATDAVEVLTEVKNLAPDLTVFAVLHGFYINQGTGTRFREPWISEHRSDVELFAFGEYDVHNYRRWGNRHAKIHPIGSLNNCAYRLQAGSPPEKVFDLCIVEGSVNPKAEDFFSKVRLSNWEKIADFVARAQRDLGLRVALALSSSTKRDRVATWFSERIGDIAYITPPNEQFATYRTIDAAKISIGETSTSLVEGLARRNKCIAMNFSDLQVLNLPGHSLNVLRQPTYSDFTNRLNELFSMVDETYWNHVRQDVCHIINVERQDFVVDDIRTKIREALN